MKTLTEAFNQAVVAKGEFFAIELESNSTTGYRWDLQLKAGKASLVQKDYVPDTPMKIGTGGKETFVFKAEEAGAIEISAVYAQAWNHGAVAKSQTFTVAVK